MKQRLLKVQRAMTKAKNSYRLVSWVEVASEIGVSVATIYKIVVVKKSERSKGNYVPSSNTIKMIAACEARLGIGETK